jgi:hypothetical protein
MLFWNFLGTAVFLGCCVLLVQAGFGAGVLLIVGGYVAAEAVTSFRWFSFLKPVIPFGTIGAFLYLFYQSLFSITLAGATGALMFSIALISAIELFISEVIWA